MLSKRKTSTYVSHDDGAHCLDLMICSDDTENGEVECVPNLACGITNALLRELEAGGKAHIHLRGQTDSSHIQNMDIKSQRPLWPPFSGLQYLTLTTNLDIPEAHQTAVSEQIQKGIKRLLSDTHHDVERPNIKYYNKSGRIRVSVPLGLEIGWYVAESVNTILKAQQIIIAAVSEKCLECSSPVFTSSILTTFSLPDCSDDANECIEELDYEAIKL